MRSGCRGKYQGEIGQPLNVWIYEDKRNVQNEEAESLRIYVRSKDHKIQLNDTNVINKKSKPRRRKLKELVFIAITEYALTLDEEGSYV